MNAVPSVLQPLLLLARHRGRLLESVRQEVRQRYAGSALGLAWAILYPLCLLSLYAIIYLFIFKVRPATLTSYEYVILVFSGLVPLLGFNEALMTATTSLSSNKSILLNTVFPAELIPVRAVLAAQVPSLSSMALTLVAGYIVGRSAWFSPIAVVITWVLLTMFVIGLSWVLSLLLLVMRDIQQALGLILMALTTLSPFAYTPQMVPEKLRILLYFNPLSYFVLSFQQAITYGTWPEPAVFLPCIFLALIFFLGGFWFFRQTKHIFFDYA